MEITILCNDPNAPYRTIYRAQDDILAGWDHYSLTALFGWEYLTIDKISAEVLMAQNPFPLMDEIMQNRIRFSEGNERPPYRLYYRDDSGEITFMDIFLKVPRYWREEFVLIERGSNEIIRENNGFRIIMILAASGFEVDKKEEVP